MKVTGKTLAVFDEVRIQIRAGNGGHGAASFRREKFVPLGGPDGGDGGRGGSVYITTDPGINTLLDFRHRRQYHATNGGNGGAARCHGAAGDDLHIRVPVGTRVTTLAGELLADLLGAADSVLVARGGRGGLGNVHFATPTNRTPREAQRGEPGEELEVDLELRLVADIGIIGLPNSGKSTYLASVTAARPKIADYKFTTLVPNLGVASLGEEHSVVLADIPGLIEGAHTGAGLGHEFLRHILRTRALIHVVDGSAEDPLADYVAINAELALFDPELARKPQVVAINKQDLPDAQERFAELAVVLEPHAEAVYPMSAATGAGVREVLAAAVRLLAGLPAVPVAPGSGEVIVRPRVIDTSFTITREPNGWHVHGRLVERAVLMTDLEQRDAVRRLRRTLTRMGVIAALEHAGVQPHDHVWFGAAGVEWELLVVPTS